MKTLINSIFLFILTIGLLHCKKEDVPKTSQANIRILNSTTWKFYECLVDPTNTLSYTPTPNAYEFGEIGIDSTSEYYKFPLPNVYGYSWVKVILNNRPYYLLPYDYIGETPLEKGFYTYKITYDSTFDRLKLELIED